MVLIQSESDRLRSQIHIVQVGQRQRVLAEVRLRKPNARTEAPEPLHMPRLDCSQRRCHSAKYTDDLQGESFKSVYCLEYHDGLIVRSRTRDASTASRGPFSRLTTIAMQEARP